MEKDYEIVLSAIRYRLNQLSETLATPYLPKELKDEYQEKAEFLLKVRDALF